MRPTIFAAALVVVLAGAFSPGAARTDVQKIVFARPFPNAGQIVLYTAAADGSDERPLLHWAETAKPPGPPNSEFRGGPTRIRFAIQPVK